MTQRALALGDGGAHPTSYHLQQPPGPELQPAALGLRFLYQQQKGLWIR